jgi:hypothetical protein
VSVHITGVRECKTRVHTVTFVRITDGLSRVDSRCRIDEQDARNPRTALGGRRKAV